MGWKKRFGAVVGAMIAFSTGVFPTEIGALIDSIVPNAGFYIVRISFSAAALYLGALLIDGIYRRWFKRFEVEVVGDPFRLGGNACLKASYRGELEKGFFTCMIHPPEGETLPTKERTYQWWPAYDTLQRVGTHDVGILSGSKKHESVWKPEIPTNYPIGTYTGHIGVYETVDSEPRLVEQKEVSFFVATPFSGSVGTTTILNSVIVEPRSV